MTNRERIIKTLLCEKTDRAPFGIGIGFGPWGETLKRWKAESGLADLKPADYFGYDNDFAVVPVEYGPCPHFEKAVLSEDNEFIVSRDYRGLTMRNLKAGGSMPDFLDNPVKSRSDWEIYKHERLQPAWEMRLKGLDGFIQKMAGIDAPIQLGVYPWGIFGTPRDLLGAEEFLVSFYAEPELLQDIMKTYTDLWLGLFEKVATRIKVDHIHIWEDMSYKNGPLISLDMVESFMMPHYDRITAFARAHAIPVISVDSDGLVDSLLPVMLRHGVNAFLPFEVQAGNDIRDYRRAYPKLGIIGGLDKNALADDAAPAAMHRELDRCSEMLALGGYVPGFDHLIPPNVAWKKWVCFMQELKKLIRV